MKRNSMALLSLIALFAASCGQIGPLYLPAEAPSKTAPAKETKTKPYQPPAVPPSLYQNLPESGMYEPQ